MTRPHPQPAGSHRNAPPSADPAHAPGKQHIGLGEVATRRPAKQTMKMPRNVQVMPTGQARRGRGG